MAADDYRNLGKSSRMKRFAVLLAAIVVATPALAADWREIAAPPDVARLERFTESWTQARREAEGGDAAEVAVADGLMNAATVPDGPPITGNWKCRIIKVGGISPIVVYGWFNCRISMVEGELFFEKLNGSQRLRGHMYADGNAFVLLASGYVAGEDPGVYGGRGDHLGSDLAPTNQVAVVNRLADGRLRMGFPFPALESTFDIIELKR